MEGKKYFKTRAYRSDNNVTVLGKEKEINEMGGKKNLLSCIIMNDYLFIPHSIRIDFLLEQLLHTPSSARGHESHATLRSDCRSIG